MGVTKKKEDDFMVMGGAKTKKNKGKKKKIDDRLTHTVDFMSSFSLLKLDPPMKVQEIGNSIEKLKEKRAYYDVLPRAPKKTKGKLSNANGNANGGAEKDINGLNGVVETEGGGNMDVSVENEEKSKKASKSKKGSKASK